MHFRNARKHDSMPNTRLTEALFLNPRFPEVLSFSTFFLKGIVPFDSKVLGKAGSEDGDSDCGEPSFSFAFLKPP